MSDNNKMVPLCGLWENKDKQGNVYLNGYLGDSKIMGFRNKYKDEGSNKPDWKFYLAPKNKKNEDYQKNNDDNSQATISDQDDIPF